MSFICLLYEFYMSRLPIVFCQSPGRSDGHRPLPRAPGSACGTLWRLPGTCTPHAPQHVANCGKNRGFITFIYIYTFIIIYPLAI